ncbi:MAG: alpha-L-fucosidase [Bacteroidales bacterium]|nr:alpha-L-fucosidase [Bacteroidales bacterium]
MGYRKFLFLLFTVFASAGLHAQDREDVLKQADGYQWPSDRAVLEKLDRWQDLKFGVLMHWGIYSVPGIIESWSICNEDRIKRPEGSVYEDYKRWYWGLSDELNPVKFNPEQWAEVFSRAGMKYMIFTTKHHDGFCMFDSQYSDYGIAHGPFKGNPKKDVAKYVFEAFRDKGFMTGAYFSKPDWHHQGFWNSYYATPNRHPNYDVKKHPDWWQSYVEYTQNQLRELTGGRYGKLDILWLDGGWITGDAVGINEILPKARKTSPGLICVDRTIKGPNENYQTPEQSIPEKQINHPWESCITLTDSWGWVPDGNFKSSRKVIGILAEIVAKGGCLVLGVGPTPEGLIEDKAITILDEIGEWLSRCGEAIYSTRIAEHYNEGNLWFSKSKDGKTVYAVYALGDGEQLPDSVHWKGYMGYLPEGKVLLLNTGKSLRTTIKDGVVTVKLPKGLRQEPLAFKITTVRQSRILP